jgi:cell division transport system ATP-binding protein
MAGDPTKIEFRDVRVEYSNRQVALRDFNLTIEQGDFVFLVGRTGAGKSTVLKLLTREVEETDGQINLFGTDLTKMRAAAIPMLRRQMGIVPQDFALLPKKTVWENVAYAMRAAGHRRRDVRRRVPEILDVVRVGHKADGFPSQLSGGEQQRVAIARALINEPRLLIADEPTGNLDPEHSWDIMETLRHLNREGTTVLVASHDMMIVGRMGKRVITMELGKIVSDVPGDKTA